MEAIQYIEMYLEQRLNLYIKLINRSLTYDFYLFYLNSRHLVMIVRFDKLFLLNIYIFQYLSYHLHQNITLHQLIFHYIHFYYNMSNLINNIVYPLIYPTLYMVRVFIRRSLKEKLFFCKTNPNPPPY